MGPEEPNNAERLARKDRGFSGPTGVTSTSLTQQYSPKGKLQHLCNKYGDFKVARAWRDNKGEMHWSKHRSVLECWESEWGLQWLNTVNNRQILPCEIVLDIDEKPSLQRLNWICDELESLHENYRAYSTGSKGYHIHIWSPVFALKSAETRKNIRDKLLKMFKVDQQKNTEKIMIALENVPHWKTGKPKKLIRQYPAGDEFWED